MAALAVSTCGTLDAAPVPDDAAASAVQAPARYEIELKFTAVSGLISGPDTCPGLKRDGHDTLSGIVEGVERFVEGEMRYEGILSRTTRLPFCEAWRAPGSSEDKWCTPLLTGTQARVKTRIPISTPSSNQDSEVRFEPMRSPTDSVNVTGACESDMELGITEQYLDSDAFTIDPRNQPVLARLVEKGVWQDVKPRPPNQPDGWTLTVRRKLQ